MSHPGNTTRGIVAMLLACLFFICNDTLVKYGAADMPIGQLLFLRSLIATAAVGLYVWYKGSLRQLPHCLKPAVLLRSFGDGASTVLYMTGLVHLPIANASAIGQALPLAVTAASAFVLREQVGWRRWLSVFIGFLGILVIIRPGTDGFNGWSLFVILSVGTLVVREMATRFIGPGVDNLLVLLSNCIVVSLVTGAMALFEPWRPLDAGHAVLIFGAASFLVVAIACSIESMLHGDVSLIAPFRYAFVIFALLIGFVVWGDVPDLPTIVGIVIVVGSGLYVIYRERVVAHGVASRTEPLP
jgi:drug/metabolite transporter (DMT)-like permease